MSVPFGTSVLLCCLLLACLGAAAQFSMPPAGPEITCKTATETEVVPAGGTVRALFDFSLSAGWHVNANKPLDEFSIPTELTLDADPHFKLLGVVYPESETFTFSFSPDPVAVYGPQFLVGVVLRFTADTPPGAYTLAGKLHFQACNDNQCAPPRDFALELPIEVAAADATPQSSGDARFGKLDWGSAATVTETPPEPETPEAPLPHAALPSLENATVVRTFGGYLDAAAFLDALEGKDSGGGLAGKSIWLIVLIVIGGGFLLNLTPCVLPLIPVNIAIIGAGARAGSKARGFALGLAYGAGIALVYGALGLVVVLGVSTAFGNINAAWWFNAGIAALFVVLALAMFDVIAIDFSRFQGKLGIRANERGSFPVAAAMGALSALLAGACVAPVVISTVVYAQDQYSQGRHAALALPFLLGAGMALPWPFLGAGLSFLPKQGMWMVRVKQAFAVFFLLLAGYYAFETYHLIAPEKETAEAGWLDSLDEGLAEAKATGKPVFVDVWATWCKNCLAMNKTTFKAPEVAAAFEDYVKVKLQLEDLSAPEARPLVERLGIVGLPAYAVLEVE